MVRLLTRKAGVLQRVLIVLIPVLFWGASGCGQKVDGPKRYPVTGVITLAGTPVNIGEIRFEPDAVKGNSGPASVATISNGQFQTPPGKGVVGGPYRVSITAYDGNQSVKSKELDESSFGTFLLNAPFETVVDFPRKESEMNFEIPASSLAPRSR